MMTLEQIGQKAKEAEPLLRVMNGEKKKSGAPARGRVSGEGYGVYSERQ